MEFSEDMIMEILFHLPVESLARCKCLSKHWNEFISNNSVFRRKYSLKRPSSSSSTPLMLGLFFNRSRASEVEDQVRFLPTCTQGNKLKSGDRNWGAQPLPHYPFDESLSFLPCQVFVVDSSNGFLLCSHQEYYPLTYFLCNPITKHWVALPEPTLTSNFLPTGFIHLGTRYKVMRLIWLRPTVFSDTLTMEIFSSSDDEFGWKVLHVSSPCMVHLELTCPQIILNEQGVAHCLAMTANGPISLDNRMSLLRGVLVFDPRKQECSSLIVPPGEPACMDRLSYLDAEGSILYARNQGGHDIEIWALQAKDGTCTSQWSLRSKVSIDMAIKGLPPGWSNKTYNHFVSFHPLNPAVLFLSTTQDKIISYNIENSSTEMVCDLDAQGLRLTYYFFPYVWPNWPPFFP